MYTYLYRNNNYLATPISVESSVFLFCPGDVLVLVAKLGVEKDIRSRVSASSVSNPGVIGGKEGFMKCASSNM